MKLRELLAAVCAACVSASFATVAVDGIATATERPSDFDAFWDEAIAALDRTVPEDAQVVEKPEFETSGFRHQLVSFATYGKGRRVYGFLSIPKTGKAPWPVRVKVPGAGPGNWRPSPESGHVTLIMNVHDYAPQADAKAQQAALREENERWGKPYGVNGYYLSGIQKSREDYFYYGAILGINRAVNWLARQPYVDLKDFTYRGQSQGGAFGIYLAALNPHITAATISEPAITDTLAFRQKRQSGWPRIVEAQPDRSPEKLEAIAARMAYFDTVNFVPRIKCPTRWLAGWIDQLCPAECVHAGYNRLNPANDKRIVDGENLGHGVPADVYNRYERLLTASWEPVPIVLVGTDPVDKLAADEFVKYYEQMSGIAPSVTAQGSGIGDRGLEGTGPGVKIGRSWAKDLAFDEKFDSYRIKSEKKDGHWNLLLAGGNARSTMYAVYEFFKSQGCRWFWDGDVVPKTGVVDLSGQDVYEVSQFEWRATRYFAHRGLRRFSAEMWGPEDWKREIDWCLKNRLNLFFFRLGMDDLFQKAFPEYCKYPDPSKPVPGQGEGFDNRQLFWSLEYRGRLRKEFTEYAYARGLMIPPDFGTITHWYTRTPEDFLKGAKPDFLPEPATGYASRDSGKVWDVRQDKWMDAYWKLTEAEIANYGRTPGPLHTIGFSERTLFTNRTDNMKMKMETTKRMFDRALRSYPDAKILFAGWDFYSTWCPEELKAYWKTLDPKHVVIFDYEANTCQEKNEKGLYSNFTEWDIVGKFPYTFGTFFFEPATPIHTDYELILKRRKAVEKDPLCKGTILWPEASHVDILEQRFFTDNAWRFEDESVEGLIDGFCADRYGRQAQAFRDIWRKVVPLSVKCAGRSGPWQANCGSLLTSLIAADWALEPDERITDAEIAEMTRTVGPEGLAAAPAIFKALSEIDWTGEFVRRDTLDLARTTLDRLLLDLVCGAHGDYLAWRKDRGAVRPEDILTRVDRAIAVAGCLKDVLALGADFSLWETYKATDAIERIRLPDFDSVLVQNAINNYCASHQYEAAAFLYLPQLMIWRQKLVRRFGDTAADAKLSAKEIADVMKAVWKTPLESMRPTLPRTPESYRAVMRACADAAAYVREAPHPQVPEAWRPVPVCGQTFYNANLGADECLWKLWENCPDEPLFEHMWLEIPVSLHMNDRKLVYRTKDGERSWEFEPDELTPNTKSPTKITEAFTGWGRRAELIRRFRERRPNGPYSFQLWGARPVWVMQRAFDTDRADFANWLKENPCFLGFSSGFDEVDSDLTRMAFAREQGWFRNPGDLKWIDEDFPVSGGDPRRWNMDVRAWVDTCYDKTRSYHFGTDLLQGLYANVPSIAFNLARRNLTLIRLEAEMAGASQPWRWSGLFTRGASRQFRTPFEWFMATYTCNGRRRDGSKPKEEMTYAKYICGWPRVGDPDRRKHTGAPRSLVKRNEFYGCVIGAVAEMLENGQEFLTSFTDDAPDKVTFSPYGEDLRDLYRWQKAHDRGVVYAPVAMLTSMDELFDRQGRLGCRNHDRLSQMAFLTTLCCPKAEPWLCIRPEDGDFYGCMFNSEFGEIVDALCPDADQESEDFYRALSCYKAAILVGWFNARHFDRKALERYVRAGGVVYAESRHVEMGLIPKSIPGARGRIELVDTFLNPELRATSADWWENTGDFEKTIGPLTRGTIRNPRIEGLLRKLQDEHMPVRVEGDIQWGCNLTKSGWLVWLINNKGVRKFVDEPEELDMSKTATVKVTCKATGETRTVQVKPGDYASVEFLWPFGQ